MRGKVVEGNNYLILGSSLQKGREDDLGKGRGGGGEERRKEQKVGGVLEGFRKRNRRLRSNIWHLQDHLLLVALTEG